MTKEVQMSIKMERELRDEFMAIATERHRPAEHLRLQKNPPPPRLRRVS
jgi:hypothetical protein